MRTIGQGTLPSPATIDITICAGWYVPSTGDRSKPAYYDLMVINQVQAWVRNDAKLHNAENPIVVDSSVVSVDEFVEQKARWGANEW